FLSGANPLNAVSSAVNKFGLFGDDAKPPAEQQPGGGQSKGPQQQQGSQKSGQSPSMQKNRFPPKQGSPQLGEKGQAGPPSKPGGQAAPKSRAEPEGQLKGEQQKQQPPSSPKPGAQQHTLTKSGTQPDSPKATSQQVAPKTGMQKPNPVKAGAHQDSAKSGPQQAPSKMGPGSPRSGQQPQGSAKPPQQQQGTTKMGQQPGLQRAQKTSEPQGASMKKTTPNKGSAAQNQPPPASPIKRETSTPQSPQKILSTSSKAPAQGEVAKVPESHKQLIPAATQKVPPKDAAKAEATKTEESVTGKMFGFGSSIFSSASTLIASAVQDNPKTTPPVSPKIAPAKSVSKAGPSACPLCTTVLNVGSKDPPNYNICTECKSTVCNQCGFNPMPNVKEGKEWLCLNCQVKRATSGSDSNPLANSSIKRPLAQPSQPNTSTTGSPQKKTSTPAAQPSKVEALGQKSPSVMESRKTSLQSQPASTLISPSSQDEPKTTPPVSPKMSGPKDTKTAAAKKPVQEKKSDQQHLLTDEKTQKPHLEHASTPKKELSQLDQSRKKNIPTGAESKVSQSPAPGAPQKKQTTEEKQSKTEPDNEPEGQKQIRPGPGSETPEKTVQKPLESKGQKPSEKTGQKPPEKTGQKLPEKTGQKLPDQTHQTEKVAKRPESDPRGPQKPADQASQPKAKEMKAPQESAKTTESVTGKMFGFGSSIFSSASTLISSAVQEESRTTPPSSRKMSAPPQVSPKLSAVPKITSPSVSPKMPPAESKTQKDQPKTTPPASPNMSPAKGVRSPSIQKLEQQKKSEPAQQGETPSPELAKLNQVKPKAAVASEGTVKTSQSTCPLCKTGLNMGSKDVPNYSTCTECKNIVCNQCGFNPMPNETEKDWLCVTCQMQRTLDPPKAKSVNAQIHVKSPKKEPLNPAVQDQPKTTPSISPKMSPAKEIKPNLVVENKDQKKTPQQTQASPNKVPPSRATTSQTKDTIPTQNSSSPKPQPSPSKTAEAVTDVKNETKLPTAQKPQTEKEQDKPLQAQVTNQSNRPEVAPEGGKSTCPLCKADLNLASKDPVKEWLCLNCQIQRAQMESEPTGQPAVKPQPSPSKVVTRPASEKKDITTAAQKVVKKEVADKVETTSAKPETPQSVSTETKSADAIKSLGPLSELLDYNDKNLENKGSEITAAATHSPVTDSDVVPLSSVAAKVALAGTVQSTGRQTELSTQQDEMQLTLQEPHPEAKAEIPAAEKDRSTEQIDTEPAVNKPESKVEAPEETEPQILSVSHDVDEQIVSEKDEVKPLRRRLSFQAEDDSSESEVTPSPKVQRRKLEVANISSSSEDIKTESADSCVEDEDFIRQQIRGMGSEEQMSLSEDGKDKALISKQPNNEAEFDNPKLSKDEKTTELPKSEKEDVQQTTPSMYKKATPIMRQATDEDVDSITESPSKGSSSVQCSSFTPESSHTSASSLDEDSDSSPSHRIIGGDKQHRKGKYRQPKLPLPIIEDSSEDEKFKKENIDDLAGQTYGASSPSDLRQVVVVEETSRTSGSEYSASIDSEPQIRQAVQIGRKLHRNVFTHSPVVVQMPDLVSSPSQVSLEPPAPIDVSAAGPLPVVISSQSAPLISTIPVKASSSASVHNVSPSVTLASGLGPVIVQMPDLVSTTSPICGQTPQAVSALVTQAQVLAQAKVVHSVPVQAVTPCTSPVLIPTVVQTPAPASTTVVKKKVPPPPPPRSTSVSASEPSAEQSLAKTDQHVSPTLTTTVPGQPMKSVIVDIQPRMEEMLVDNMAVASTRSGHVVIIVPSAEKISLHGQTPPTTFLTQNREVATQLESRIPSNDATLPSSKTSGEIVVSASSLSPKPIAETRIAQDASSSPPTITHKPPLYPKPQISKAVAVSLASATVVTTVSSYQPSKPPPPIPPKPTSIPAGLVFSHKPGESVNPPTVVPKAATLPRTKEPPNALSLSLTRHMDSKLGTTSPKSPLSPRYAKCLQTYVVITLPSELGSPPDAITVQAPVRRASVPHTRHPPPNVAEEQLKTTEVPVVVPTEVQVNRDYVLSVIPTPPSIADDNILTLGQESYLQLHSVPAPIKKPYVQQQQPVTQPLPTTNAMPEVQPPLEQEQIQSIVLHPDFTTEVTARVSEVSPEVPIPQAQRPFFSAEPQPQTDTVTKPQQPETATHPLTLAAEFTPLHRVVTTADGASSYSVTETQQITGQQNKNLMPLQIGPETPKETLTNNAETGSALSSLPSVQPQTVAGMPTGIITTEETTMRRRSSVTSTVHSPYVTNQLFDQAAGYEIPTQVANTEAFTSSRRESITIQHPLPAVHMVSMPAERDLHTDGQAVQAQYNAGSIPLTDQKPGVLSYSSEYAQPLEIITTEAYTRRTSVPTAQDIGKDTGVSLAPVTIAKFQQDLPNLVTQVVTTEVQRTTVSVVHERLPQVPPPSIAINIQPDLAKVQPLPKQNGRIIFPGEVVDLRTMKTCVKMTEQGMDLTPPDSHRQAFLSDPTGRPITAVQPEIVNLSSEITPAPTLSVVTDSITIVTCTATISSHNNTPAEKPLDLQDPVTSLPLPLTTYKPFEPLAQIVYKPVNSQSIVHTVTAQDTPINLSFGVSPVSKSSSTQGTISNGRSIVSLEATGAIDLSNYRPVRAMVALSDKSSAVVASVVEDDGIPVDLTAGRRSVCCDVIYKLPFTGSCRTQPPVTTQPDGLTGSKGMTDVKASVSESNLMEPGLFLYDTKTDGDYLSGSSDGAMDLTAAHLSAGKALDYTSKSPGSYPGTTAAPHSQVPAAGFGVNSTLRTADGIVYSSVAAPVPSTYAITTQPGSIFSTTLTPMSLGQNEALSHLYGFIPSADPGQFIPFDPGLGKELLPTALADIISGYPDIYSDTTLEAIAASLDALSSSPIFPGLDNSKMAQYQMEREFLELEKLKQLCLAEELEWERQEIQRYREQEQFMVQREIEELQALKHQLLFQQEEEHHAHMVAQQETYAQQKEQLHQIQQLQLQLQRQLDEHYGSTGTTANLLDAKYAGVGDSGQYWPVKDEGTLPSVGPKFEESQEQLNIANKQQADQDIGKKIIDSGVQTDDEDSSGKHHVGQKRKNKKNIDSDTSGQTDDEDQDEWDAPSKARRRSRKHSGDGKHGSKVSSIAIQTVAEISVQTDHSGTIKKPNVQMDTKVEIIKHISAPENSQKGGSLSCQTESDRRHTPIDLDYSTHLTVDMPSKSKIFYSQVCPLSPEKSSQGMLRADPSKFSSGPRILKAGQKSLSDPKPLSPSTEDRMSGYYLDSYSYLFQGRGLPSGTGKKVKRTLPDPPPEDDSLTGRSGYSTNSARRRLARSTTMARAKILQDIDKELDLVERESSKLRKKQAELDEEEKEIDAKLRYLEMGINRRKEALLKEREKRERAYLQGVAEERDYMSDSEVSNIREARGEGLERPRTAPQSEFDQFIPPQTEADSQYNTLTSPYSPYAQYVPQTQTTSHFTQQNLYQQPSLYQVSPYPTLSLSHGQTQASSYQHALLLQQGKQHQSTLSDLEPKITSNYEVIRNQPLLIVSTSTDSGYGVPHLGGKYANVDLRLGLEERSMASSPMSSISADSFYADIDHHNARNYVLIEDIGELTKTPSALSSTGLGSGFSLPDKEMSKADRLLRATEARRTAEVADFLGSSRLQTFGKGEDDTMEDPYELKLLKQQIKQEFRRGTDGLDHLTGLGLPHYIPSDSSFRHFPKGEKYSIGRLTLEKQAAKQLPAAVLYQKQMKNKKALIDPKAITKFSPIQESRDLEPDFTSYMGTGASSVSNLAATARLLQDEITFGLRKNLAEQQKYLSSPLGGNLAGSLNLGQSLGLGSNLRATGQDDGTYPSGTRSRPSSRPSSRPTSVYGLDLSIKRDLSSSSLRLKTEGDVLEAAFAPGVARAKPTSLPISQSRGRIPIVAQNSEEESPLSPVGQPMGMARASAGPLPPISADTRDQFGSSHSLPEVQQHMREESRTLGYERDTAFIIDDLQGAMSDSEAYHLRREDTDWFDKPREGHPRQTDRRQVSTSHVPHVANVSQMKLVPYACPHTRLKLRKDPKDTRVSGNGLGIRVVGGKEIPGRQRECGAYIAKVFPGGVAEQTGKVVEGMQVLEWNGVPLTAKTYEEVQGIIGQPCAEVELCVRLDLNMLSDPEHPQALEHHVQLKAGGQRSPGVDPKQLAAELQKVSQQQTPTWGCCPRWSALPFSTRAQRARSAASSGVPSPGQPASPAINKKQRSKPAELLKAPHPITGEIQLQINYDRNLGNLIVHVLQARNLASRDNDSYSDPFVKVYLLPGRGQVMVVQNASADNKRRTRYAQKTLNPEWNQTVIYKNIHLEQLKKKTLEVTVWDYDRSSSNDFLGEVLIDLSNTAQLDNVPRWLPLKEQSESIEHSRAHRQAPGQSDGSHDSPKNSVIKSRSHGIFPDPAKDLQMMPLEKCHSSPGSSKSSSDGQLRSHGPSRSQSKSSVTQAHLEDAGIAIAAAEAAVQQSCLQPRTGHRLSDVSGSVMLSAPNLAGDAFGGLNEDDGEGTGVDSAIFQVPRIGKTIPNGTDKLHLGTPENEGGKTQVMGEIKVALKKEVKTEGDQLVLEILQCRNITYKFKSPDHLPPSDLYVKLYVVNIATQKRIIKKKTRVCRHDREPSFNETFRFPLNPTGHSIQLFLVSNGGKFMKKTLIGEAYIWLDKVDMRKRVVSWHKLFVSSTQTN
uniref:Protein piccolo n=1 Tax=Tetraodon nigroviridis TaxID=99883 RepID=H3DPE6_TETNG